MIIFISFLLSLFLSIENINCYLHQHQHQHQQCLSAVRSSSSISKGTSTISAVKSSNRLFSLLKKKSSKTKFDDDEKDDNDDEKDDNDDEKDNENANVETMDDKVAVPSIDNSCNYDDLDALMNEGEQVLKKSVDIKAQAMSKLKASNNELITTIQTQINLRCLARKNLDFTTADDIFNRLANTYDVDINDKQNFWYSKKYDIRGPCFDVSENDNNIIPQFKDCSMSFDEVQGLVNERIIARRQRNFKEADRIRTILTHEGIELKDNDNIWRSYDGKLNGQQSNDFENWLDKKANDKNKDYY